MGATLRIGLFVSSILVATTAWAEDAGAPKDYARPGAYFGVNAAFALANFPNSEDPEHTWGASARLGYRFISLFAAEAEVDWYDDFGSGSVNLSATANAKVYPELWTGRVQFYLLGGLGFVTLDVDEELTELLGKAGGGLDIYLTEHIVANIEMSYALPFEELADFQYVPIKWGLQFRL
jgi:hypothetical protein